MMLGIIVFVLCLAFLLGNLYLLKDMSSRLPTDNKKSSTAQVDNKNQPPKPLNTNESDSGQENPDRH